MADYMANERIIIVEGKTDKQHLEVILDEQIDIICTFGTLGVERMDELIDDYNLDDRNVFVLVDEDDSGLSIRQMLTSELPHAHHINVSETYREVALTPAELIAIELVKKGFKVKHEYLNARHSMKNVIKGDCNGTY
ncbi:MAG TPA: topoisomerase [Bacillota bacterium]|nr:topoisomerase [Bacillota bacterium]